MELLQCWWNFYGPRGLKPGSFRHNAIFQQPTQQQWKTEIFKKISHSFSAALSIIMNEGLNEWMDVWYSWSDKQYSLFRLNSMVFGIGPQIIFPIKRELHKSAFKAFGPDKKPITIYDGHCQGSQKCRGDIGLWNGWKNGEVSGVNTSKEIKNTIDPRENSGKAPMK